MKYKFDGEGHLHSLDGKPLIGTSTVLSVLSKPLTWWAAGLAVGELGWSPINGKDKKPISKEVRLPIAAKRFSEIKLLTDEDFLKLLDKAYRAHSSTLDKSATKGTDMHAELEHYVKDCIENHNGVPQNTFVGSVVVATFRDWAVTNVKRFIVSEGHCFSEELWTGGIADLLFEDTQGRLAIMDFKSSKEAYLSQFFQVAGYDIEISENGLFDETGTLLYKPERSIDYYAVFPFGMENPEPQFHFDTTGAKNGFKAAVTLYKLINQN